MHRHTCELSLAGRLLLWSWRHAVRAQRRRQDLPHFVLYTLAQLPQGERVAARAESLFAHWVLGASRSLLLACPDEVRLSRDEGILIEALIAAHFGFEDEVRLLLAEQQHGGGLRRTTRACLELARLIRDLDLSISIRTSAFVFEASPGLLETSGTQPAPRQI